MKKIGSALFLFFGFVCFLNAQANEPDYQWLDNSLAIEERAEALVSAMTIDEKILQLMDHAPAIDRLGVPEYGWWNEALHGVARSGRATVFPQAIAFGATFDEALIQRVGEAIANEARAKYNVAIENGNRGRYAGLTFWSPNVNIFRDPRWGRGQETYGEDPFLTSRIGVSFVKGLQGDDPNYLKAAACAKHYVVHSGPEAMRHAFDAQVSKKDLWETYMPAFQALVVEAKVEGVMGAYNRTNGEACCASPYLMMDVLREKWGFDGYFVSDCGAVNDIWRHHKLCGSQEEAAALAVNSGMNLNCGSTFKALDKALEKGLLTEEAIDRVLMQLMETRFRLGFFDPADEVPFGNISADLVGCEEHVLLAREVARKSMVMVKNLGVLPLKKDIKSLYVVGPQAGNVEALLGNYYGVSGNTVCYLDGIASKVSVGTSINYRIAQLPYMENVNGADWVTGVAAGADACIAVMGINSLWEGEEGAAINSLNKGDNTDCKLPKAQIDFLRKISERGDNPLIVVITSGSPVIVPEVHEFADAVIYSWYAGEQGGNALGDILFGDVSPSGRLPFTVPQKIEDLPPYEDYAMEGRTYRYMVKEALFPFGFGLSYTTFDYSKMKVAKVDQGFRVSVDITNTGNVKAEEVAQLYISSPLAGRGYPLQALKGIKRIEIAADETVSIEFMLDKEDFMQVGDDGELFLPKGDYKIAVAGALPVSRSVILGSAVPVGKTIKWKTMSFN